MRYGLDTQFCSIAVYTLWCVHGHFLEVSNTQSFRTRQREKDFVEEQSTNNLHKESGKPNNAAVVFTSPLAWAFAHVAAYMPAALITPKIASLPENGQTHAVVYLGNDMHDALAPHSWTSCTCGPRSVRQRSAAHSMPQTCSS